MRNNLLLTIISAGLLVSCSGGNPDSEKIDFEIIISSFYSSVTEKKEVVVNDEQSYRDLMNLAYEYLDQKPQIPEVDFKKYTVIGVFMGAKTSGGYSIHVEKITKSGNKLNVNISEISPGRNCGTTDAITYPFEIIKIPRTDLKFKFKTRQLTRNCE